MESEKSDEKKNQKESRKKVYDEYVLLLLPNPIMPRMCMLSWKKTKSWNNRSKSMRATKRNFKVNLIKKKMMIDGVPFTVKVSAKYYKKYKNMFVA